MTYDFTYYNPTRIHFGKHALQNLPEELAACGDRVMLVYGGGSVKRAGIYDEIVSILTACGKSITEYGGISANPTADQVYAGIKLTRTHQIDFILAVGGGSVIDCAKAVAAGARTKDDFWKTFFLGKEEPEDAIELGVILTMVGTGSEMNGNAVITHPETKVKTGMWGRVCYPVFSILNPEYTYSLPPYQMVSGICDIISHVMEVYMSRPDEDNLSDDLSEAVLRNVIRNARIAIQNPRDFVARSNLMWDATVALSGILKCAKLQDWEVHQIEHPLSGWYNVAHGMGLAVLSPHYYRYICPYAQARCRRFAIHVFEIDPVGKTERELEEMGIDALADFFRELGAPATLRELGVPNDHHLKEIALSCNLYPGGYRHLTHQDIEAILRLAY